MFICQIRLLVGRFPAGEELNEADEVKVERSGFAWRRGWFGRRVARCAESCETLLGVDLFSSLLTKVVGIFQL